MKQTDLKFDCLHFRGDIPCRPNKLRDKVCDTCDEYEPVSKRVLIIKLGAIGDVIRTTPLIHRYRKDHPGCHITWITLTPAIVPRSEVNVVYPFDHKSTYALTHLKFDIAINLDKDIEACALLNDVKADRKYGFALENGHITALNAAAERKLITGLFDNISQANTQSYLDEIFEICDLRFDGEEYILDVEGNRDAWQSLHEMAAGRRIIGLNTGCGKRWLTRLWPTDHWVTLIDRLDTGGYFPMLLGGPDEDALNRELVGRTGCYYPGTFSLQEFISLTSQCDTVVTAVTMMMHIALGLKVPLALFVNIFNSHEFELYDNGVLLQPESGCDCYFGNTCRRDRHCMNDLSVETVFGAIVQLTASDA